MSSSELNINNSTTATTPQQSDPAPCSNECGFFANSSTNGLCSKCYKHFINSITSPEPLQTVTLSLKATPKPFPPFKTDQNISSKTSSLALNPVKKNRCLKCNKKVGLVGFKCRCGDMFCSSHKYPETHECEFDFKANGRNEIFKANPVVKADKLRRL